MKRQFIIFWYCPDRAKTGEVSYTTTSAERAIELFRKDYDEEFYMILNIVSKPYELTVTEEMIDELLEKVPALIKKGEKIVIVWDNIRVADILHRWKRKHKKIKSLVFNDLTRNDPKINFNDYDVIIGSIQSLSIGLSLKQFNTVIYALDIEKLGKNTTLLNQFKGRFIRL